MDDDGGGEAAAAAGASGVPSLALTRSVSMPTPAPTSPPSPSSSQDDHDLRISVKQETHQQDGTLPPLSTPPTSGPPPAAAAVAPALPPVPVQPTPVENGESASASSTMGRAQGGTESSSGNIDSKTKTAGALPSLLKSAPSPAAPSSTQRPPPRNTRSNKSTLPPFSLWDYLREEVLATDFDSTQEIKYERVSNFMSVPLAVEKIMFFGMAVCLDSFLYTFTILPLRFCIAIFRLARNYTTRILRPNASPRCLSSSHKCDILKLALVLGSCLILSRFTDASKMYHSVRGQDVVKLSVIFNVLEIADRLCCSLGQDLLDSLFSRTTLARRRMPDGSTRQPFLRPAAYFLFALAYILAHSLVLLYQLVTLNVAINAFDNALLTLLLSNQFVEIKGSVFKRFEKENLFQLTCADIVERFQLGLMLFAIGTRNLIELSGGAPSPLSFARSTSASVSAAMANAAANPASMLSPLPTSFTILPSLSLLETVLSPVLIVIASECLVDWLKHAFITKFNHLRPAVYGRFMDVLCSDLVVDAWATPTSSSSSSASKQRAARAAGSERVGEKGGEPSLGSSNSTSTAAGVKREAASATTTGLNGSSNAGHESTRRAAPDQAPVSSVPFPHDSPPSHSASTATTTSTPSSSLRRRKHTFVDQSPLVARRLGFAALPLACLIVRITQQILSMLSGDESDFDECIVRPGIIRGLRRGGGGSGSGLLGAVGWAAGSRSEAAAGPGAGGLNVQRLGAAVLDGAAHVVGFALVFVIPWAFLIVLKLLLGMNLAAYAAQRHATASSREREEALNARNRPPIGMGAEELAYEARVSALLDENKDEFAEGWNLRGEAVVPPGGGGRKSGVLMGAPGVGGALVDHQQRRQQDGDGGPAGVANGPTSAASGKSSSAGGKKEGKGESLMDVSRYTMVRSRIW
ncbi:hypothetical protein V8E36_000839 [Tilletia maclaganii]